ncbi:MAG TPA: hypothetical protein VHT91_15185 [Kofleriaceae bacterium]|jgi:hypothetical protein|nr:hypothetical protein [Kofleriaceae bacterium]
MNVKSHWRSHSLAHGQACLSLGQTGEQIDDEIADQIGEDAVEGTRPLCPVGRQSSGTRIVCQ